MQVRHPELGQVVQPVPDPGQGAGGNFNTNVVAVRFINELITNGNAGRAATIVVILVVAIIPLMIYQVRNYRAQEATR